MDPTRRALLGAVAATLAGLAGCAGNEDVNTEISTSERPTASATATEMSTPTATADRTTSETVTTPEPTTIAEREPREVLPRANGEWELTGIEEISSAIYGGVPGAGIAGWYEGPDGTQFQTVAIRFREALGPDHLTESWACIDYDVAVGYGQWGFATGTGTEQQTFTPEAPPHMDQSPVPGTVERSRELLAQSPILSESLIDDHEVTCQRDR